MAEPDLDALADQIATDAAKPQQTVVDGVQVQQRPLTDQIGALQFLERRQAARSNPLGQPIRVNRPDALG